ncbi:uncharacterized protein EKO05_0010951 [Ascochyta rabiei]|uniref:uncharacterized protein n=1 Tax=Didymella rabiei TaxID=5454 RepID=UPI001900A512|nr:uncharacterized protein EKO05_0010951 [Ascochyta rabiei]UPX20727.1 hypothetical protein EKO05_0010951 [Ascochyta rabiei]
MGSRAFAERLLRPSTFTRIAPSSTAHRCLSTTIPRPAARPARPEAPGSATTPQVAAAAAPQRPASTSTSTSTSHAASQAIDDLFAGPPSSSSARGAAAAASDLAAPTARYDHVFGAEFSKPSRGRMARTQKLTFGDMIMPEDVANPSLANKPSPSSLAAQQTATFENYPRLNPTYGRAVDLDATRGRDLVRGIGMLGSLLARNKVKNDFNKQRFHERGGLKRKRLNSERWRARFQQGFRDVTARVMELTGKGW